MKVENVEAGMRVYFVEDEKDTGTVVEYNGSTFSSDGDVWVKWDNSGEVLNAPPGFLTPTEEFKQSEQEAVMLLLSLGYTITKNAK